MEETKKVLHILHIYEDEDHELVETVEEVLRQLKMGCTSGVDPDWDMEEA